MSKEVDLDRAYAVCREYVQSQSHGYGMGSQWLPPAKRPYADALLAFVMHTDTLADDTGTTPELRAIRFRDWCDLFEAVHNGRNGRDEVEWSLCQAFVDTMTSWGITRSSVDIYLNAQATEVTFTHFVTYEELRVHADELIGTTCAWANVIYGGTTPEAERRARQLAMASQLSDYLVDLRADLTHGRLYLPLEDLYRFGVSRRDLERAALAGETPDQIRELVLFEAARALDFCDCGSGWEMLVDPLARDAAWLPGAVYRHQLEQIRRTGGDIFGTPPIRVEELADRIRVELERPPITTREGRQDLPSGRVRQRNNALHQADLPVHVGIILDGNRRWARNHGVPIAFGHRRGAAVFRDLSLQLLSRGIEYLSAYLFSTENWAREPHEVSELMVLLGDLAEEITDTLCAENIRMRFLGRPEELPYRVRNAISSAEQRTAENDGATLAICVNYGGFAEIADAFRGMVAAGVSALDVTPQTVADYLYAPDIPPVDLVLRTGGEQRLSNFMLWRAAYAELAFIPKLWPDVTIEDIESVIDSYAARARRFGS